MGDWVEVAKLDDIGPEGLYALVHDEEILLVRRENDVFAMSFLCSHQELELQGGHCDDGAWVCPHHGARFDLRTGDALSMPAIEPIRSYPVKIEGGLVFLKGREA